jgi:hypothetical protein
MIRFCHAVQVDWICCLANKICHSLDNWLISRIGRIIDRLYSRA